MASPVILGINASHGHSSACAVVGGKLVAAAEEGRFHPIKDWAGLPVESVRYCLSAAGLEFGDVDVLASNSDPSAAMAQKVWYVLRHRPDPRFVLESLRHRAARRSAVDLLEEALGEPFLGRTEEVEHHRAHLSSAFHVSPFEEAVVVSVDGFGDFASACWGVGRGSEIRIDGRVYFPHSLGVFCQAMTQFIGFPHYADEYEVMGLASCGEPRYLDAMRQVVRLKPHGGFALNLDYFVHHRATFAGPWENTEPTVGLLFSSKLESLLGPARQADAPVEQRHKDIARSVQAMYEEAFFHLLNALHRRYGLDALALAGGCAMNSVANGKVTRMTPFRNLYVQSPAGDAGGALGAAFSAWHGEASSSARFRMDHACAGPEVTTDALRSFMGDRREAIEAAGCVVEEVLDLGALCTRTASAIAQGKVVGWFQGRMEWGPSALGNRSILGDPRRADMTEILNLKFKRGASFRPFAPSILRERLSEWFEQDGDVPVMLQEKRAQIPAVTHVDGSGHLQTVTRESNPRYYALIEAFEAQTGVPMVLNISLSENAPLVCQPQEALDCFLRTKMDVLVLAEWFIERC